MTTMPSSFQEGTGARGALVDKWGNLDSSVTRVLGGAVTATEAAGAAAFATSPSKMKITLSAVLNAGVGFALTVTNPAITANSVVLATVQATTGTAATSRDPISATITSLSAGTVVLNIFNGDAANTSAAPVVHVALL